MERADIPRSQCWRRSTSSAISDLDQTRGGVYVGSLRFRRICARQCRETALCFKNLDKMNKRALITGITGQNGSYLAELLLGKGYEVHGIRRFSSAFDIDMFNYIGQDGSLSKANLTWHFGDLTDSRSIARIVGEVEPDEIYNIGAQSHVQFSFEAPEYTVDVNAGGPLRLLEAIRYLGLGRKSRFYQASTSEIYDIFQSNREGKSNLFRTRSPYAVSKLQAHRLTLHYREVYGFFACNGILFNHESPRRGVNFVTRKITRGLSNISQGLEKCLLLGNLNAIRDWGHARDYVQVQWLMLQQEVPEDYVIATGKQHSVREFVDWSAQELGISLRFEGNGSEEIGIIDDLADHTAVHLKRGDVIVRIDPRYFRQAESEALVGNPSKAKHFLGWEPMISARETCAEMVAVDLAAARRRALSKACSVGLPASAEE